MPRRRARVKAVSDYPMIALDNPRFSRLAIPPDAAYESTWPVPKDNHQSGLQTTIFRALVYTTILDTFDGGETKPKDDTGTDHVGALCLLARHC